MPITKENYENIKKIIENIKETNYKKVDENKLLIYCSLNYIFN